LLGYAYGVAAGPLRLCGETEEMDVVMGTCGGTNNGSS
jgi:hypothetical protein